MCIDTMHSHIYWLNIGLHAFRAGKTDPYVVFILGEQVIRSKRNSKTSIIRPAGAPVWNQVHHHRLLKGDA